MGRTSARQHKHQELVYRIGDILKQPVYRQPRGGRPPVLLLAAGHRIESELQLRQLRDEGYAVALPGDPTASARLVSPGATPRTHPATEDSAADARDLPADFSQRLEAATRIREWAIGAVRDLVARLGSGRPLPMEEVEQASSALVDQVHSDASALVALTYLRGCDDYTVEHSANVAILMTAIARLRGVPEAELPVLALAGLMHDVGKQRVPPDILNKRGTLTAVEFEEIRQHPLYGWEIVSQYTACPEPVRVVALQHHERLDGSGYPSRSTDLDPYSRIAAVADTFDAMTSDRVYRRACAPRTALFELYRERGKRLDSDAVDALIKLVGVYPVGCRVRLDTGLCGAVIAPNLLDSTRPVVRVDRDLNGRRISSPRACGLEGGPHRVVGLEE